MPPEAAAVAEPLSLNVPAAEQPPAEHKPRPSFDDRYKAKQAELGITDDEEPEGEAEAAPQAEGEPEKPKRNQDATAGDKAMFETLAKKLGYQLDGSSVSVAERAAWRQEKAREKQAIDRERSEWEKTKQATPEQLQRVNKAESILSAIENGDPDGFAAAIGKKNFNEFQEEFIRRLADPNYKQLKELEGWKKAQEEERQRTAQEQETQRKSAEYQRQLNEHLGGIASTAKASNDPVAASLGDDPLFVQAIFNVQKRLHREMGEVPSLEQALDHKFSDVKMTLREELKTHAQRFAKAFPELMTAAPASEQKNGKKVVSRTAVTPRATIEGASVPKKPSEMGQLGWRQYANQRLREAEDD